MIDFDEAIIHVRETRRLNANNAANGCFQLHDGGRGLKTIFSKCISSEGRQTSSFGASAPLASPPPSFSFFEPSEVSSSITRSASAANLHLFLMADPYR